MKFKYWITFVFAMLVATFLFVPSAMAQTGEAGATLVREVTLSPGNWLWNHYMRMSPEYRRAHPYKQFFESETCYLKDRKCTEEDWKHVPRSQAVYIPVEQLFVRVPPGVEVPGIALIPSESGAGVIPLIIDEGALSSDEAAQLTAEISYLEKINSALRAGSDFQENFFRNVFTFVMILVIMLAVLSLFLWSCLSKTKQKLRNAESCFRGYPSADHPG